MNKRLGLISKILSGEKSIETRWYQTRSAPWNKIEKGDVVWFKESGGPVVARADVSRVLQFKDFNREEALQLVKKFGDKICFLEKNQDKLLSWILAKRYAILIFLENAEMVAPFDIDKTGYGSAAAWLCVDDIETIKKV